MNLFKTMVDVEAKNLTGVALDWAVAIAKGNPAYQAIDGNIYSSNERWAEDVNYPHPRTGQIWSPSTDLSLLGPLMDGLEGMKILNGKIVRNITIEKLEHWYDSNPNVYRGWSVKLGHDSGAYEGRGDTLSIAVCRGIVAAKLGTVVKVQAALVMP